MSCDFLLTGHKQLRLSISHYSSPIVIVLNPQLSVRQDVTMVRKGEISISRAPLKPFILSSTLKMRSRILFLVARLMRTGRRLAKDLVALHDRSSYTLGGNWVVLFLMTRVQFFIERIRWQAIDVQIRLHGGAGNGRIVPFLLGKCWWIRSSFSPFFHSAHNSNLIIKAHARQTTTTVNDNDSKR